MEVQLKNLQKSLNLHPRRILQIAKIILKKEGVLRGSLSLVFVSSQKIKALNKKFLGRDYVTDVLAFDLWDRPLRREMNGEVIICAPLAMQHARQFGCSVSCELSLYLVHGILHLLGYDDRRATDIKKMRRKEAQVMNYLGKKTEGLVRN